MALPVSDSICESMLFHFPCVLASDVLWLVKRLTINRVKGIDNKCEWRAQGDDFRTFISDFVSNLTHLEPSVVLSFHR